MIRLSRRALLTTLAVSACTSPDPAYYALAPVPGRTRAGGPRSVKLRRIALAGYLDRETIIRGRAGYRLETAANQRWGESLGEMIGRTLAEDLTQRLPGSTVFTEMSSISAEGDATVEIDIQRFDAGPDGSVLLVAQIAIERKGARTASVRRPVRLSSPAAASDTDSLVAAMSAAVGQLADVIAAELQNRRP
ncbi:MAG TPA: PqiC family protein [Mycobacteriales bacterium]|nr:PqiC family protein [Mycobacteriales bacterium]